ncbi:LrgB family protein, partial [uncultured Cetobacterium sp.]
ALIGSVTAILSVVLLGKLLGIQDIILLSFVPKSITTPIGIEVSKLLGGIPAITVFAIMVTGIAGNIFAPFMLKLFRIENAVAKGLGIGISSHAVGTSKAIEMGEVEGAMSALSIVIAGIITIFIAPVLLNILK